MSNRDSIRRAFLTGTATALFVAGGALVPANAQIEEIIVTAQKRAENIQDVPISISTVNGEELGDILAGGEDILALATRIPSFYAESSNGRVAPRFYIRGLGNTDFDLAASQPVSMYIDDVVMENVVLKSTPLFDVQQVEVLRGPQGSLFGRNTSAGLIKFTTNRPSQEPELIIGASTGTNSTTTIQGAVSGGLTDRLSARLSLHRQSRNDWISNTFTGENDAMGGFTEDATRLQLLWEASDATSLLFNVHTRDLEGTAAMFRANILGPNGLTSDYSRDEVRFDGGDNNPQAYAGMGYSITLNHEFANGYELTYIGAHEETDGFSRGDIDGGNMVDDLSPNFVMFPSDTKDGIDEHNQDTHEIRLSSQGNESVNWQVGTYFFNSDLQIDTDGGCCFATVAYDNKAWAVFGQAEFIVNEDISLTGGLRYTDEEKDFRTLVVPAFPVGPVSVSDSQMSWDMAAHWAWTENTNLYGRVALGYRGPSIQGRDVAFFGNPSTAKGEENLSYEVGSKSVLMDGRMRLNFAAYRYTVEDQQVSAVGGAGNLIQLVNLDETQGRGFEFDVEYQITDYFSVDVGYSYNHTEISDSLARVGVCGSTQCTYNPADEDLPVNPGTVFINGNPLPQAPESIFNVVADWRRPAFEDKEVFLTFDYAYQGDTNLFLYEAAEFAVDSQFELGFKTGVVGGDGSWEVALFGRNITDEDNIKGAIDFNNNTGFVNDPRMIGVSFNVRY